MIYQRDPEAAPDGEFTPGRLADLVPGNRGRLLDPRRTPVTLVDVNLQTGMFAVRVEAFEDAGALWEVPLEEVGRFQFARGGETRGEQELRRVATRLDRPLEVAARDARLAAARLTELREAAREWVVPLPDLSSYVEQRIGEPALFRALAAFLDAAGVLDLERAFAERFVSNPWSGELVKGHAIVLAQLGLCPFRGKAVRDPALFDGAWSRERRAEHLLARIAFVRELYAGPVTVFRGSREPEPESTDPRGATDHRWIRAETASFVSTSFSRAVAAANVEGRAGALLEWRVAPERLFMTFMETEAMSRRYREAEAVLLAHQTVSHSAP